MASKRRIDVNCWRYKKRTVRTPRQPSNFTTKPPRAKLFQRSFYHHPPVLFWNVNQRVNGTKTIVQFNPILISNALGLCLHPHAETCSFLSHKACFTRVHAYAGLACFATHRVTVAECARREQFA